jgi:hypothetical protein
LQAGRFQYYVKASCRVDFDGRVCLIDAEPRALDADPIMPSEQVRLPVIALLIALDVERSAGPQGI